MNSKETAVKQKYYPDEEEMRAAQLACCGRFCNACETPAEYAWRKREIDMSLLLERAIEDELTETEEEIVKEYWFDSESLKSVAEKHKIKPPTVRGTLNRAQKKIERVLRYVIFYQQGIMSESVVSAVVCRARVIASARNHSSQSISERIKNLRISQGFTVEKLKVSTGIPESRINEIENGVVTDVSDLIVLSDFFNVTTDYILKGEFNEKNIV